LAGPENQNKPRFLPKTVVLLAALISAVWGSAIFAFPSLAPMGTDSYPYSLLVLVLSWYLFLWWLSLGQGGFDLSKLAGFRLAYLLPLLGVLVITTWAAARVILLYVLRSISSSDLATPTTRPFSGFQYSIFNIVGWALVPFLVFTLARTLWVVDPEKVKLSKLIRVVLIALTIGVLVTVPTLSDSGSYALFPYEALPTALIVEVGSMFGLVYAYRKLNPKADA
jgi:hypothetical protein